LNSTSPPPLTCVDKARQQPAAAKVMAGAAGRQGIRRGKAGNAVAIEQQRLPCGNRVGQHDARAGKPSAS
jgi:hypothetical protein